MKKIGILFGQENTFPQAFVESVNSKKVKGQKGRKRGQTRGQYQREQEYDAEFRNRTLKQIEESVLSAENAMEQKDFLGTAKYYANAAELSKKIKDKDKVLQFSEQAAEMKKIHDELVKDRKK